MAVYKQLEDGTLEVVRPDMSLGLLLENIQKEQEKQNIPVSDCSKDLLNFNSNSNSNVVVTPEGEV